MRKTPVTHGRIASARSPFLTGLMATVVFVTLSFGGVYSWAWGITAIVLMALLFAYDFASNEPTWVSAFPFAVPMAAFAGLIIYQWLDKRSLDPGATFTGLLQLAAGGAAFLLACQLFSRPDAIRAWSKFAFTFTAIVSVEALIQHTFAPTLIYGFVNAGYATPTGPYFNRDSYAGLIELLLPLAWAWVFHRTRQRRSHRWSIVALGLVPVLAFAGVIISQSRTGALILALETIAVLVMNQTGTPSSKSKKSFGFEVPILIGFTMIIAAWTGHGIILRFQTLLHGSFSALDRWRIVRACWAMFLQHRWIGIGFGAFSVVYPGFSTNTIKIWLYAHNEYAQTLAETGILGMLPVLTFVVLLGQRTVRLFRRRFSGRYQCAAMIACWGILLHSLVDFQFHIPANCILFFITAGIACASIDQGASHRTSTMHAHRDGSAPLPETVRSPGADAHS